MKNAFFQNIRNIRDKILAKKRRVYLDFAGGTPPSKTAINKFNEVIKEGVLNPSSVHAEGVRARVLLEHARETIARTLSVHTDEVIFTSGGTESDAIAITGVVLRAIKNGIQKPHVITSVIEHPAVLEQIRDLEDRKLISATYVVPKENGLIDPAKIVSLITDYTVLISISLVNGETGGVAPIRELGRMVSEFKTKNSRMQTAYPYVHTDASQAGMTIPLMPNDFGVFLMTIDSGKFGGLSGVGALYVRRGIEVGGVTVAGGQERGLRSGTQSVALASSMASALSESQKFIKVNKEHFTKLRDRLESLLESEIEGVSFTISSNNSVKNIVSFCVDGLDSEFAVIKLDSLGFAVSSASACRSVTGQSNSYVISSIPNRERCAASTLRVSFGVSTTEQEIEEFVDALKKITNK